MVRSRSETNLNRIFVELCTSPEVRTKHAHQTHYPRQYHPPLPHLQSIKSNSCSNINDLASDLTESTSSFVSDQTEHINPVDLTALQVPTSSTTRLEPKESTGFTVQSTNLIPPKSPLKLFETLTIDHTKVSSSNDKNSKTKKDNNLSISSNSSNTSQDWKYQDFTNRLQNRLKSRGHLRKFFLS